MTKANRELIAAYLKKSVGENKHFFKAKLIARELGMTPRTVGTNMGVVSVEHPELHIEKWSHNKCTTWRVTVIDRTKAIVTGGTHD